jgi:hypothetical protein
MIGEDFVGIHFPKRCGQDPEYYPKQSFAEILHFQLLAVREESRS